MGFSRQEDWSGLPFPSPGGLPDPGIEPAAPALAGEFFTSGPQGSSRSIAIRPLLKSLNIILLIYYNIGDVKEA